MTMIPYEIWLTGNGDEVYLMTFVDPNTLSDTDAKTEAVATLQDIIDKINTPGAGETIEVRRGLITPVSHHLRKRNFEDRLDS